MKDLIIFFRENRDIIYGVMMLATLVVERWLGTTDKVKAGSIIESIENVTINKIKKEE